MGQRHVRGRLESLSTTNRRRYKKILSRLANFLPSGSVERTAAAARQARGSVERGRRMVAASSKRNQQGYVRRRFGCEYSWEE